LFLKDHFEGGYLYRDTVFFKETPPTEQHDEWTFEYWFANQQYRQRRKAKIIEKLADALTFEIPIEQPHPPGIKARVRVQTSYWNQWHTAT